MASNVAVEEDAAGNLKPSRRKSSERIDGVVALINTLGRAISDCGATASVYDSRGILVL
jgi:phage terminase large subunit-like protein